MRQMSRTNELNLPKNPPIWPHPNLKWHNRIESERIGENRTNPILLADRRRFKPIQSDYFRLFPILPCFSWGGSKCICAHSLKFCDRPTVLKILVGQSHFLTLRPVGRSQNFGRTKSIIDSSIFHMKERAVNRVSYSQHRGDQMMQSLKKLF